MDINSFENYPFDNIAKFARKNNISVSVTRQPIYKMEDEENQDIGYVSILDNANDITIELCGNIRSLYDFNKDIKYCNTDSESNKDAEIIELKTKITDYKQKICELKQNIKYQIESSYFYSSTYKNCLEIIENTFKDLEQYPDNY